MKALSSFFNQIEILLDCKRVENKNNTGTVIGKMKLFLDKILCISKQTEQCKTSAIIA